MTVNESIEFLETVEKRKNEGLVKFIWKEDRKSNCQLTYKGLETKNLLQIAENFTV